MSNYNSEQIVDKFHSTIDINKVIEELKEYKEFVDELCAVEGTPHEVSRYKTQMILDKIGVKHLIDILLHTGQDDVASELSSQTIKIDLTDLIDVSECTACNQHKPYFSFGDVHHEEVLRTHEGVVDQSTLTKAYLMEHVPRGYALLVNNYFTKGTHKEMHRFRNIFDQLKYKVIMKKNLTAKQITEELKRISQSTELKEQDAFVFMFLGHGDQNGIIYGFDDEKLEINQLIGLLIDQNFKSLKYKPRMLFFNCCRGVNPINGDKIKNKTDRCSQSIVDKHNHFGIFYSTLDGYEANVNWDTGTNFGRYLADTIVENAKYKDINSIITRVNDRIEENHRDVNHNFQPCVWVQNFTRRVFLH